MKQQRQSQPLGSFAHAFHRIAEAGKKICSAPGLLVSLSGVHQDGVRLSGVAFFMFGPSPILSKNGFLGEIHCGGGAQYTQFAPISRSGKDVALELEDFASGVERIGKAVQLLISLCRAAEFQPAMTLPKDARYRALTTCSYPHNQIVAWAVPGVSQGCSDVLSC